MAGARAGSEQVDELAALSGTDLRQPRRKLAAAHRGDDRPERSDAEGAADHARHGEDPRCHAGLRPVDGVHRGRAHRRHHEADTEPLQDEGDDEKAIAGVRRDAGHPEHRCGHTDQAGRHQRARADAVGQTAGDRTRDHHAQRRGQEAQPRLQRGEVKDVLHVQRQREEGGEHHEGHDERDDVGAEVGARAEEAELHHRRAPARLDHHERGQRQQCNREQRDHPGGAPAPRVALHEREHERRKPEREACDSGNVDLPDRGLVARLARGEQRHPDRCDRDGDVEDEDRLPADVLDEQAAQDRPDRQRHGRHPGPRADRTATLVHVERVGDDRQGRRHHEARPDALHGAKRDQPGVAA